MVLLINDVRGQEKLCFFDISVNINHIEDFSHVQYSFTTKFKMWQNEFFITAYVNNLSSTYRMPLILKETFH